MTFNKTTAYSLHILSYMSREPEMTLSARHLNKMLGIPYSYLRLILGNLSRKGLISSTKGREGGFRLSKETSQLFLSEIIEATEGLDDFRRCVMGFDICPFNQGCTMHPLWVKMRTELLNVLEKTSLADLLTARRD